MRFSFAWGGLGLLLVAFSPGVARAQSPFISEVYFNPAGSEGAQEWVELHNPDVVDVDIGGWTLQTVSGGGTVRNFTLPGGTTIPAGNVLLVAASANLGGAVPCVAATVTWGNTLSLGNDSGSQVGLINAGSDVDRVQYLGGGMPAGQEAHSLAVINPTLGNDDLGNWAVSQCPLGAAAFGSPGVVNTDCTGVPDAGPSYTCPEIPDAGPPDSGPVIPATRPFFSEIFYDSPVTSDTGSEWVEIFNPTDADIALTGWTIRSFSSGTPRSIELGSDAVVPARGVLLLAASANLGGVAPCAVAPITWGGDLTLYNSDATVELIDDVGETVDSVSYEAAGYPPAPAGTSLAVIDYDGQNGNDSPANWVAPNCSYGSRDYGADGVRTSFGSPGLPNDACGAGPVTLDCLPVPDGGPNPITDAGGPVTTPDAAHLLEPLDAGVQENDPPTVTVTEPSSSIVAGAEGVSVSWSAFDPDGDVMAISVLRSAVGAGNSGEEVLTGLPSTGTRTWDTTTSPPGIYRVLVRASDGHGNVTVTEAPGTVEVRLLDTGGAAVFVDRPRGGEVVDDKITVTLRSTSADGTISVFYDTDSAGLDGKPIQGGLRARVGVLDVVWATASVPAGNYFVYAVLDSPTGRSSAYSAGAVQVAHGGGGLPVLCRCAGVPRNENLGMLFAVMCGVLVIRVRKRANAH